MSLLQNMTRKTLILSIILFLAGIPGQLQAKICIAPEKRYDLKEWQKWKEFPSLYPYLCEFGYRNLADHVIDPNQREFDPDNVQPGDTLYVAIWYLDWFVSSVHDQIRHPYILITCDVGGYLPSPGYKKLLYDPKVAFWFSKNMLFTHHPKLHQLPMGQFYYLWAHTILPQLDTFEYFTKIQQERDILLYLNYTERPHGRRVLVSDLFHDKPYCFNRNRPRRATNFAQYWEEASRSKFVLSPLGLEVDCTRTWECFLLGAIPVVEHSFLDPLYKDLPILLVHDWKEIDEAFLLKKYEEIQTKPIKLEKVFIDYWADLIHEKQDLVRTGDLSCSCLEATNFTSKELQTIHTILNRYNKTSQALIYYGNLSALRPFQIAKKIPTIPIIKLFDPWAKGDFSLLKEFSKDKTFLKAKCVLPLDGALFHKQISAKDHNVFLDLKYFRHKLFTNVSSLNDFQHSLQQDLISLRKRMPSKSLLLGNSSTDPYVHEVLERLEKQGMRIEHLEDFWFHIKEQ